MDSLIIIKDDNTRWGVEVASMNANFAAIKRAIDAIVIPTSLGSVSSVNNVFPVNGNVTIDAASVGAIDSSQLGAVNGVAQLGSDSTILNIQLPQGLRATDGLLYRGAANLTTNPGTASGFYFALAVGEYTQFVDTLGNTVSVTEEEKQQNIIVLVRTQTSGAFTKVLIPFPDSITSLPWSSITDKPDFATVAFSGDYSALLNAPDLKTVATTGSYNDLTDKPDVVLVSDKGVANGVASLDENAKIPDEQVSDASKNIAGAVFIGSITTTTDIEVIKASTTAKLFGFITTAGTYRNLGDLSVTAEQIQSNIVVVYGRDTFEIIEIPITSFVTSVNNQTGAVTITASGLGAIEASEKDQPNGVPTLTADGKLQESQLPASINWAIYELSQYPVEGATKALYFKDKATDQFTLRGTDNIAVYVIDGTNTPVVITAEILLSKRISGNTTNAGSTDKDFIIVTSDDMTEEEVLGSANALDMLTVSKLNENASFARLGITVDSITEDIKALSSSILVDDQIDVSTLLSLMILSMQRMMRVVFNPWKNVNDL